MNAIRKRRVDLDRLRECFVVHSRDGDQGPLWTRRVESTNELNRNY